MTHYFLKPTFVRTNQGEASLVSAKWFLIYDIYSYKICAESGSNQITPVSILGGNSILGEINEH